MWKLHQAVIENVGSSNLIQHRLRRQQHPRLQQVAQCKQNLHPHLITFCKIMVCTPLKNLLKVTMIADAGIYLALALLIILFLVFLIVYRNNRANKKRAADMSNAYEHQVPSQPPQQQPPENTLTQVSKMLTNMSS